MRIPHALVAVVCTILASHQITAVVNNAKTSNAEENNSTSTSQIVNATGSNSSSSSTTVADSLAEGSEQEATRRDAPIAVSPEYGAPLIGGSNSYIPTAPSNPGLPVPIYGVPDAPSNNVVYPAPPADIPPPLSAPAADISTSYGPPLQVYGPPKPIEAFRPPPQDNYGPPPPPPQKYGAPIFHQRPPKPFISQSFHSKPLKQYGPPRHGPSKPLFIPKGPKPNYGPPKQYYGPPKIKPIFGPPKHKPIHSLPPKDIYGPPPNIGPSSHGPPQDVYGPPLQQHFGPPDPVPHGPPHPGAAAPPTPPDIKYDGWQPIPGLVSRPPADTYGAPDAQHHGTGDLLFNSDFTPPPVGASHGISSQSLQHSAGNTYSSAHDGLSDSYGAPLNTVTGSGGVVSSAVPETPHDDHSISLGLSAAGITAGQDHLSVIKSIRYELFPNSGGDGGVEYSADSYGAPPLNSYSATGPYAAAHSYSGNGATSHGSFKTHGLSLSSSGIGLIPPSGVYGVPPSGQYGTPLFSKPSSQYGAPLNALKINPPKRPVIFREPVPAGLIESIGQHTAHKDAHGIIESGHNYNLNSAYIPPPVSDFSKPLREQVHHPPPPPPSNLYSLPSAGPAVSFQNIAHGSSHAGLPKFNTGEFGGHTSYTAPLGSVDGSYGLPLAGGFSGTSVGIDNSHPPLTIDLTGATSSQVGSYSYQNVPHDCSLHKSQPLPTLSYGVPSVNSYTASLASLTTNIGGVAPPQASYGPPDLHAAHSQTVGASTNAIEDSEGKTYGKSLAESFVPGSELIKSDSIDINNIPVQGDLGSYTLQIQSADGPASSASAQIQVPHAQVLNDGLLQSILAAIEQPQQKDATILGQPLLQFQPAPQHTYLTGETTQQGFELAPQDAEAQHSVAIPVVISPTETDTASGIGGGGGSGGGGRGGDNGAAATKEPAHDTDDSLHLIDNNEIALYFSNNHQNSSTDELNSDFRNGQQYGSYVTFKSSNSSYGYGDLPSSEKTDGPALPATNDQN